LTLVSASRPSISDIEAAAGALAGHVWHTPLRRSSWLSDAAGAEVFLKLECVQTTGSFKFRGALNALTRLRVRRPAVTTVATASAGNHGLAMATAAATLGLKVRVHVPATAPRIKRDSMARLGAEIVEAPDYDEAEKNVRDDVARTGAVFVSAYSDSDVISGAGTAALEMIGDEPGLNAFMTPLGGGGLLSGTAIVARARAGGALVIGAEAEASPVFTGALEAGRPVIVPVLETLADGLAGNMEPNSQTFEIVRDLADRVVLVPERLIAQAMSELARYERLIVEGAGAAAVAAVLSGELPIAGRRVGVILSGSNIDDPASLFRPRGTNLDLAGQAS
jgi:threonine dehydratase